MVSWLRYCSLLVNAAAVVVAVVGDVPADEDLHAIGWAKHLDPATNVHFYYTFDHSEVTWDNPFESGAAERAKAAGVGASGSCANANSNDAKLLETFEELVMAPKRKMGGGGAMPGGGHRGNAD